MNAKKRICLWAVTALSAVSALAATTIDANNRYAYGVNAGWVDWCGDTNNGAVIGQYVCSGYIYGANIGWINLGGGSPTNGIRYANAAANDFGVNNMGDGRLRGMAYGANIGWINFEDQGNPCVDMLTGQFSGYAYGANIGWISLSNVQAFVQTDTMSPGPMENGLPMAWELEHFGHTGVDPTGDPDKDGASNLREYLAGTDPNDIGDKLEITCFEDASGTNPQLTWTTKPIRHYQIEEANSLTNPAGWCDCGLGLQSPDIPAGTSTRTWTESAATQRFYRVKAVMPLTP